ncbi:hypothetical protein YC2023_094910 [Brassica napus]
MASHSEDRREEEKKRLQVTFNLPENCMNRLISERSEHYPSVGADDALHNFFLPSMEKEARSLLTSRAKSRLLSEYGQVL